MSLALARRGIPVRLLALLLIAVLFLQTGYQTRGDNLSGDSQLTALLDQNDDAKDNTHISNKSSNGTDATLGNDNNEKNAPKDTEAANNDPKSRPSDPNDIPDLNENTTASGTKAVITTANPSKDENNTSGAGSVEVIPAEGGVVYDDSSPGNEGSKQPTQTPTPNTQERTPTSRTPQTEDRPLETEQPSVPNTRPAQTNVPAKTPDVYEDNGGSDSGEDSPAKQKPSKPYPNLPKSRPSTRDPKGGGGRPPPSSRKENPESKRPPKDGEESKPGSQNSQEGDPNEDPNTGGPQSPVIPIRRSKTQPDTEPSAKDKAAVGKKVVIGLASVVLSGLAIGLFISTIKSAMKKRRRFQGRLADLDQPTFSSATLFGGNSGINLNHSDSPSHRMYEDIGGGTSYPSISNTHGRFDGLQDSPHAMYSQQPLRPPPTPPRQAYYYNN